MYFPEREHPAFGIFRATVKDSTDIDHGAASQVWKACASGVTVLIYWELYARFAATLCIIVKLVHKAQAMLTCTARSLLALH